MNAPPDLPDDTLPHARSSQPRVGAYRLDGELGRGGMGVVYRAFDERLHREVALKALPPNVAADGAARARLEQEARALARIQHPNVAAIFGLEESDGTLHLVLELVPGRPLGRLLENGALPLAETLSLCAQVAAGLEAVHRKGLVHGDLKPANVMITPEGAAKILDFGLARRAAAASAGHAPPEEMVAGTPGYMSPEQLRGEPLDAASDAWAWGCLLYECLSGAPAFGGCSIAERVGATLARDPDWDMLPATTPAPVVKLLRACLSKDREARPADMGEARRRLDEARLTSRERVARTLRRHALPAERDAFVGRSAELAELDRLVASGQRLVSVVGLGGAGKTRLVLHHARTSLPSFPGGAWFCDLSEARSEEGVVHAVATALEVPLGSEEPVAQLGHAIAGRGRCLVILDNFEQVSRHATQTLGRWLDRCEEACFIVTTREVLGLAGEHALSLPPLRPKDAEALFMARASQARHGAQPDASEPALVAQLVALLDCLPLAIELAAARVRVMPVKQVLVRMTERFKLLTGSGARRDRQATLRATIDWSWELLAGWEKAALAQLSVFEGGFTLESAEAVLDLAAWPEAPWTVDVVQALVDKSLLQRVSDERLEPLVTVHEYAAERLIAPGAFEGSGSGAALAAQRRHGAHFAACGAQDHLAALDAHGGTARRRALALDLENLAAACRRSVARNDGATATATLLAAWEVLKLRGPFGTAVELGRAVTGLANLTAGQREQALRTLGDACRHAGHGEEAQASIEAALVIARELGCRTSEAVALGNLGLLHFEQGRMEFARSCLETAQAIARDIGDRRIEGQVACGLGHVHSGQGRMDEGMSKYEAALAIAREIGDRRGEGLLLANLGYVLVHENRLDAAWSSHEAALVITREAGDRLGEGRILSNMGSLRGMQGRFDEALSCCEAALVIFREAGDRRFEGITLGSAGMAHASAGRFDAARAALSQGESLLRDVGDLGRLASLLAERARAEYLAGDPATSRAVLSQGEEIAAGLGAGADSPLGRYFAETHALLEGRESGS